MTVLARLLSSCPHPTILKCPRVLSFAAGFSTPPRSDASPEWKKGSNKMLCWQVFDYGGSDKLKLTRTAHIPTLSDPRSVLIKVHASSVNPIDIKMIAGYGSTLFNIGRKLRGKLFGGLSEFPLTPGLDFSGEIVQVGKLVPSKKFSINDEVWGTLQFSSNGSHSEYIIASINGLSHKPKKISHVEAASIPYVAATTWSALFLPPKGIQAGHMAGKRVLILGGSGGVGTFAIQLFKAWGADVTAVCGTSSLEPCLNLGADIALDYNNYDVKEELKDIPRFDFIYDLVGKGKYEFAVDFLRDYSGASYVSIVNPVLANFDNYGLAIGSVKTAFEAGTSVAKNLSRGKQFHWAFHQPSSKCMSTVADLVDSGKIKPVVAQIFPFSQLPEAYKFAANESKFGKVVVDMST